MSVTTQGQSVRVRAPFDQDFPEAYSVAVVDTAADGQVVVYLDGIDSAFSPDYLELAE